MDAVALWRVVPSVQRARRVQGRSKGSGVRLLFVVLVASVVLASAYSFWSTFCTDDRGSSGRLGRALVMRQPAYAFEGISCPMRAPFRSPCFWQSLFRVSGCCRGVQKIVFFRVMSISVGAMRGLTVDTCCASVLWWLRAYFADSGPAAFFLRAVLLCAVPAWEPAGFCGAPVSVTGAGAPVQPLSQTPGWPAHMPIRS